MQKATLKKKLNNYAVKRPIQIETMEWDKCIYAYKRANKNCVFKFQVVSLTIDWPIGYAWVALDAKSTRHLILVK